MTPIWKWTLASAAFFVFGVYAQQNSNRAKLIEIWRKQEPSSNSTVALSKEKAELFGLKYQSVGYNLVVQYGPSNRWTGQHKTLKINGHFVIDGKNCDVHLDNFDLSQTTRFFCDNALKLKADLYALDYGDHDYPDLLSWYTTYNVEDSIFDIRYLGVQFYLDGNKIGEEIPVPYYWVSSREVKSSYGLLF